MARDPSADKQQKKNTTSPYSSCGVKCPEDMAVQLISNWSHEHAVWAKISTIGVTFFSHKYSKLVYMLLELAILLAIGDLDDTHKQYGDERCDMFGVFFSSLRNKKKWLYRFENATRDQLILCTSCLLLSVGTSSICYKNKYKWIKLMTKHLVKVILSHWFLL